MRISTPLTHLALGGGAVTLNADGSLTLAPVGVATAGKLQLVLAGGLQAAVADAGVAGHLVVTDAQAITSAVTIPSGVTLEVLDGALLTLSGAGSLAINGALRAGPYQVFAGTLSAVNLGVATTVLPEWFGTGAGNTWDVAINAAIAAAGTAPRGGVVALRAADYNITNPVQLTKDRVSLRGDGRQTTRIVNNSLTADGVQLTGLNSQIYLRDLEITGVAGKTAGNALSIANCGTGVMVDHLFLNNHQDGVLVGASVYEPFLHDMIIADCTGSAFHVDPGAGTTPVDVSLSRAFFAAPSGAAAIGINIAGVSGLYIHGVNITGSYQHAALFKPSAAGQQNDWGVWSDCLFDASTASCFLVDSSSGLAASVNSHTFTNCWFSTGGVNGLELNANNAGLTVDGLDFIGCRFYHSQHEGIHLYGATSAMKNIVFTDCHVAANSQAGAGSYNGILIEGGFSHWRIRGGRSGQEASGTGYGNTQNFGLAITSTVCTDFYIDDFDCTGNMNTSGITVASGVTNYWIKNCPPYNPRGLLGPPAVPAANTNFTNPYGCDCTVYVAGGAGVAVTVNGVASGLASGPFWLPANAKINLGAYTTAPSWQWAGN